MIDHLLFSVFLQGLLRNEFHLILIQRVGTDCRLEKWDNSCEPSPGGNLVVFAILSNSRVVYIFLKQSCLYRRIYLTMFCYFCRRIVLVAIQDEGAKEMTSSAYRGLRRIGVRRPQRSYRGSFAFIGYTGPGRRSFVRGVCTHTKGKMVEIQLK